MTKTTSTTTTMGRSQYLLNRSKQRFKAQHGRPGDPPMRGDSGGISSSTRSGGDDHSSSTTEGAPPLPIAATTKSTKGMKAIIESQYNNNSNNINNNNNNNNSGGATYTSTSQSQKEAPQQQGQQQKMLRQDERHFQYMTHDDQQLELTRQGGEPQEAAGADFHYQHQEEDMSFEYSRAATPQIQITTSSLEEQQNLQQQLERQQYEHHQQQLQLRQEQLRQQEQLRWQQHQLQLQKEQMIQQEQLRQMRQQQQIRHQKHHHQQRHQYQSQQKQLREQQEMLEQQYYEQQERQQGACQQEDTYQQEGELEQHQEEQGRLKEVRRRERKDQKGTNITVRKGWWRRQQQVLKQHQLRQHDDEGSLYDDLHNTITPRHHASTTVASHSGIPDGGDGSVANNRTVGRRGVTLDVRVVADALSFLDKANRLQIPAHLVSTLVETYAPFSQGTTNVNKEDMMRKNIASRHENQLYGGVAAVVADSQPGIVQQPYSPRSQSSGYNSPYSHHQNQNHLTVPATFGAHQQQQPYHQQLPQQNTGSRRLPSAALSVSSSSSSAGSLEQSSTITSRMDTFEESSYAAARNSTGKPRFDQVVDTSMLVNPGATAAAARTMGEHPHPTTVMMQGPAESTTNGTHLKGLAVPGVTTEPSTNSGVSRHHEKVSPIAETPLHRNKGTPKKKMDAEPTCSNLGDMPTVHLASMASPPTVGVSMVATENADDDHVSFPSLKINEAFTNSSRNKKGSKHNSSHQTSRRHSPSPSDVLMTYSVTHNEDTSNSNSTRSNSNHSRRSKSGVSSVHSRRSVSIRKGQRETLAEKIRQKIEVLEHAPSRKDRKKDSSKNLQSRSLESRGNEPPAFPPTSIRSLRGGYRSSSGSGSSSSSRSGDNSRSGNAARGSFGHPTRSNDNSDNSTVRSRRTVDEYRPSAAAKGEMAYNLTDLFSDDHEDSASYTDSKSGLGYMPSDHYHRRDHMADYEDNASISVSDRGDDRSIYSRRSQFSSSSFVANGNNDDRDSFLLDPISSSYERQHQSRYPQQSYRKVSKKVPKRQRYAPIGIPRGGMSAGLLLEEEPSSHENEEDLDRWLESAMASKSVDGSSGCNRQVRQSGDEADLDEWLDNVIRR